MPYASAFSDGNERTMHVVQGPHVHAVGDVDTEYSPSMQAAAQRVM
eukprot:SAG11_NODE_463_length_9226_cov_21.629232_9_plen_46_part_00